jgi:recombination protein RecA
MSTATLRAQLESVLIDVERRVWTSLPTGISALDALTGGLPRGAITEVFGPPSSGRTSIALAILAAATAQDEICALIDGRDSFDPASGASAGVDLEQMLWVRCRDVDQVLRSTDLLLQGGGFGLVVMDLTDLPIKALRTIPLAAWFRFQRVIEKTPTSLLLVGTESLAKSAASLVLRMNKPEVNWNGNLLASNHLNVEIARSRQSRPATRNSHFSYDVRCYSHS